MKLDIFDVIELKDETKAIVIGQAIVSIKSRN